jgi:hypothetical protein
MRKIQILYGRISLRLGITNKIKFICIQTAVLLTAGCATEGPRKTSWIDIDNAERKTICVVLNSDLKNTFSFENHKLKRLDHGRISVIAEIRNRTDEKQVIEISTVFRSKEGIVSDQSVWQKFIFNANQTISYKISSIAKADSFTVRIRKTNES